MQSSIYNMNLTNEIHFDPVNFVEIIWTQRGATAANCLPPAACQRRLAVARRCRYTRAVSARALRWQ